VTKKSHVSRRTARSRSNAPRRSSRSPAAPTTRLERRAVYERRRTRLLLACSVVIAAGAVFAWFPTTSLLHQREALAAASEQLSKLRQEDKALTTESQNLSTPSEIARIASEQYDLVSPGQQAYQVLPPSTAGNSGVYPTDPGIQPLASPSGVIELPSGKPSVASSPGSSNPSGKSSRAGALDHSTPGGSSTAKAKSSGVVGRILQTLEFWR